MSRVSLTSLGRSLHTTEINELINDTFNNIYVNQLTDDRSIDGRIKVTTWVDVDEGAFPDIHFGHRGCQPHVVLREVEPGLALDGGLPSSTVVHQHIREIHPFIIPTGCLLTQVIQAQAAAVGAVVVSQMTHR